MLVDARSLPDDETVDTDVCIVGAGPAGITLALELLGTGARVCVLESGGGEPREVRSGLVGGDSVGYPYATLKHVNRRALGGTSHCWRLWHVCPLDRIDFERRQDIPGYGWPFERSELVPYYRRAEDTCGAEPFDYAEAPEDDQPLSTRLPLGSGALVARSLQVVPNRFGEHADRLVRSETTRILLHAVTDELVVEPGDGPVTAVRALTGAGRRLTVRARAYVLATGGIETPRLLLLNNKVHGRGIGNQHDLVGRYFMEHPSARSGVIVPDSPALMEDESLYYSPGEIYSETEGRVYARTVLALDERVLRREGVLNVAFLLEGQTRAFANSATRSLGTLARAVVSRPRAPHLLGHGSAVLRDPLDVSRAVIQKVAHRTADPEVLVMRVQAEQEPSAESRVTLGNRRDAFGRPLARLDWRLSSLDTASIRRAQDVVDEELKASGLGAVEDKLGSERVPVLFYGLYHHLGTTRMHEDPKRGVVDADCRVHGIPNLYVAGSSVFPTAGWANPTLTIVALAIRLGDHLKRLYGLGREPVS